MKRMEKLKNKIRERRVLFQLSLPVFFVGVGLRKLLLRLYGRFAFYSDLVRYKHMNQNPQFYRNFGWDYRCLTDRYESAGMTNAYFWQDLWAARLICQNNPARHYDIGSRIDGFIANLASFRNEIYLIDIRPFDRKIPGVHFFQADATSLAGIEDDSVPSLSALCSLEHFGLGRYGDPIDPDACFKAMHSIVRVLAPGGDAYIAVPVGWEHLEFNAHRIFYASSIVDAFSGLELKEYSVADDTSIQYDIDLNRYDDDPYNRGRIFGLFHFCKPISSEAVEADAV